MSDATPTPEERVCSALDWSHKTIMRLPLDHESRDQVQRLADEIRAAVEAERDAKDQAYEERNRLVALLASLFPSVQGRTAIEGWSEDWHGCVYIELPTGQVSWHFHDSHAHLFSHVLRGEIEWDGHTTPEKYERVARAIEAGE